MTERYKQTGEMPPGLAAKPVLGYMMHDYLEAYTDLARRRQQGYGSPQPLSVTEILEYGRVHGFSLSLPFFFKCISALDDYHLIQDSEERARKRKRDEAKSRSKSRK